MIIPQSLAYAGLANVPSIQGLWTSWMPLVVYSILGSSRHLCVGPESVVSILVGSTISSLPAEILSDPKKVEYAAGLLSFLVGLFLLIFGLLRWGFVDNVLSRPILCGFINALAVIIAIEQLDKMIGVHLVFPPSGHSNSMVERLWIFIQTIPNIQWLTFFIGISSVSLLLSFKYAKQRYPNFFLLKFLPGILVVVFMWTMLTWLLRLDYHGVAILKTINGGFPIPRFPLISEFALARYLIQPAATIAIIGFVESLIAAKTYASKYSYPISTNRELVALGATNLIASFFGSYPASGSLSRSSVAALAGMKTQLSSLIQSVLVLLTILFLTKFFYYLPSVVMGSIVFVAAIGLVETHDIIFMWRIRAWKELALMLFTFVFTFVFGVSLGIGASIAISVFMVLSHTTLPHLCVLGKIPGSLKLKDVAQFPEAEQFENVLIIRIDEAIYFANIMQIRDMIQRVERFGSFTAHPSTKLPDKPQLRGMIIDTRNVPSIDAASLQVLKEIVEAYHKKNITVCFVKLRDSLKTAFVRSGIIGDVLGAEHIFSHNSDALDFLQGKQYSYSSYRVSGENAQSPDSEIVAGNPAMVIVEDFYQ